MLSMNCFGAKAEPASSSGVESWPSNCRMLSMNCFCEFSTACSRGKPSPSFPWCRS
jgi:hypothetical protein